MALINTKALSRFLTRLTARSGDLKGSKGVRNRFAEALYNLLGSAGTRYDPNGPTYVEKGYNSNPDVYAILQQMATKTMAVPYEVKRVKDKSAVQKARRAQKHFRYNDPQALITKVRAEAEAFEEEILPMPLARPNTQNNWGEFFGMYKTFLRLTGNAYFLIVAPEEGSRAGQPVEIYNLPAHLMNIVLKPNADLVYDENPVDHYLLIEGNTYTQFPGEDVIHIRLPNPNYDYNGRHLYGQSPLAAALMNIQTTNEGLLNNVKTMRNGGAYGLIYSKGPEGLSASEAQQLKDRLKEMDADKSRLSNFAAIGTEVGYHQLSLDTDKLLPFDFFKFDQKTLCNVLGWSDKLLNNDDGAKYDNVAEFRKLVITDNIMPDLELLTQALNDEFLPRFPKYQNTEIYFDALQLPEMQQDTEKLVGWMLPLVDRAIISRNEFRQAIGYNVLPAKEMDLLTVNSPNVIPLEEVLIAKPEPVEGPPKGPQEASEEDDQEEEGDAEEKKFDPNQPRDAIGRWTRVGSGGSVGYDFKPQIKAHNAYDGSTFNQQGQDMVGAKGQASVSIYPEKTVILETKTITPEIMEAYYAMNESFLKGDAGRMIGTWYDSKTGWTWLDIVHVTDLDKAIELGRKNNQKAVFDLENLVEVDTGGTGVGKEYIRALIRKAWQD